MKNHEYASHVSTSTSEAVALDRARLLGAASLAGTVMLLALGTVLAAADGTSSCEGWPLCTSDSTALSMLNISHRLGSLALILATGGLALLSYSRLRPMIWLHRLAAAVFILVLGQSVLGGLGVAFDFPGWASAIHLSLAMSISDRTSRRPRCCSRRPRSRRARAKSRHSRAAQR